MSVNQKDRTAEKLRAMREVCASPTSSDHEFGPFTIADANVVLDLVLTGWYDESEVAQPEMLDEPGAFESYVRMHAMRRALFAHAVAIEALEMHPSRRRGSQKSWRAIGILNSRAIGETHYRCLFCNENLATLGHGTVSRIAAPLMRRLTNHATACAMRFLIDIDDFGKVHELGAAVQP